jgi:hypothetical protein
MHSFQLDFLFQTMVRICEILTKEDETKKIDLDELKKAFIASYLWDEDND